MRKQYKFIKHSKTKGRANLENTAKLKTADDEQN